MKKNLSLLIIIIFVFACSKQEEKLELFSAEAFAYSMESGWELNGTCRVKGFEQKEEESNFKAKLSFLVDLETPDGKLLNGVGEGLIDRNGSERFIDLPIETQVQLDSAFKAGKYKIIFNITDDFSGKTATIQKEFELSN